MVVKGLKKKTTTQQKKVTVKYFVDCSAPVEDNILDPADLEKFFLDRIKVGGKTGNLGDAVRVERERNKIWVHAQLPFSKRYLKYLTKKYLKKQQLRDYLRVLMKESKGYEMKYFNISAEEEE